MKLYHGSNVVVENFLIIEANRRLDFGAGFYLIGRRCIMQGNGVYFAT